MAFCPDDGGLLVNEGLPGGMSGRVIASRYQLGHRLGEGGMGEVYAGTDLEKNEVVAVKLVKGGIPSSHATRSSQRLDMEARAMASLHHPGIAKVLDSGRDGQDACFLVMERLRGPAFDLVCRAPSVTLEARLRWIEEICEIVSEFHGHGIAHRDLKPSNIMLHQTGDEEYQVKILDFGLAKIVQRGMEGMTRTGEILGTYAYMSPEQIRGDKEVGVASDVYSLGVIIFELLAGERPFQGASGIELMRQHQLKPAPYLSRFVPEISLNLERVVQRCLSKVVKYRYSSASELVVALNASPGLAHGDGDQDRGKSQRIDVSRSWVGKLLNDRFEIEAWLAYGRLGSNVYRAKDLRTDGAVAIRLWDIRQGCGLDRPDIAHTLLELVRRETKTLQVRNPGLISIYDLDFTDESVYVVTELVGGESLSEYLRKHRPLSRPEAVKLVQGAAESVGLLHQSGIVTGGMSLDTIRVVTSPVGQSLLLLSPFGVGKLNEIAELVWQESSEHESYVAPEQYSGIAYDKRSDVYVLGKIFLEMIREFDADANATKTSLDPLEEGLQAVAVMTDGRESWAEFLRRSLAAERDDRFADATEFLAGLASLLG